MAAPWRKTSSVATRLLVGVDNGVTDVCAQLHLWEWARHPAVEVRGATPSSGIFHPKIYAFVCGQTAHVLLGSVNLTHRAFHANVEAALYLSLSLNDALWLELSGVFEKWWQNGSPLKKPEATEVEVEQLGLEERVLRLFRAGVLVDIEAHLAAAHAHFEEDFFELGRSRQAGAGQMRVEERRNTRLLLMSNATRKKLEGLRDQAHKNCHQFAVVCAHGNFIPAPALALWKQRHRTIAAQFKSIMDGFANPTTQQAQRKALEAELPDVVSKIWRDLHNKRSEISLNRKNLIVKKSLEQFDACAPMFSRTINLQLQMSFHPFASTPSTSSTLAADEVALSDQEFLIPKKGQRDQPWKIAVETEVESHIQQTRETVLRDWMTTLVVASRKPIENVGAQFQRNIGPDKQAKLREELSERLLDLAFYSDELVQQVLAATGEKTKIRTSHFTQKDWLRIGNEAGRQVKAAEGWNNPQISFDQVLFEFAQHVGWVE